MLRPIRLVDVDELDENVASHPPPLRRGARVNASIRGNRFGHQKKSRKSLVKKKSMIKTVIAPETTVIVVERPTPSAPPVVRRPLKQAIRPIANPKKNVFPTPEARSLYFTVSITLLM